MGKRTIASIGAAAGAIFGGLGIFGHWILRAIGFVDQAQELDTWMKLVPTLHISWPGVYLFLFILSLCVFVWANWHFFWWVLYAVVTMRHRNWNMRQDQIVEHIKTWSYFAASLERDRAYELAVEALQEAAQDGRIKLAGRKAGASKITHISRKECKDLIFSIDGYRVGEVLRVPTGLKIINRHNPNEQYVFIYADRSEVEAVWPRAGS